MQPWLHNPCHARAVPESLDDDGLGADTVRQVAKLMAAAATTAPKSGGQLFLAGKHLFIATVRKSETSRAGRSRERRTHTGCRLREGARVERRGTAAVYQA